MTASLLLSLKWLIAALIFAIGLDSNPGDLTYLWRRPLLLIKSLTAMYVVVPLTALLAVRKLSLPADVGTALLVLAISAGAPLLPRKLMKLGNGEYVFSLVVTTSLLAIVTVPAWLRLLGPHFNRSQTAHPGEIALTIGLSFLLPLLLGMAARWIIGPAAQKASDLLMKIGGLAFALCALLLLVTNLELVLLGGWMAFLCLAAFSVVSLMVGHAMGGPEHGNRTALGVACATRHVGLAILVATAEPGPTTAAYVVSYLLASAIVSVPYIRIRGRERPT
jgi:BASS family bile acid:Na+ symporter